MSYQYQYGFSAADNLTRLLQSQNAVGLVAALYSGAEPNDVLIAKCITNSTSEGQNLMVGTPAFVAPTGTIAFQITSAINSYLQGVLQNTSNGASASTDFIVNNDLGTDSANYADFGINSSTFSGSGPINIAGGAYLYNQSGPLSVGTIGNFVLKLFSNSAESVNIVGTNVLLGGLTVNGTGVLQFPAATTSAGGITFGTDASFYRFSAGQIALDHVGGTAPTFALYESGVIKAYIQDTGSNLIIASNGGTLRLRSANTDAITIDTSQNATFAKSITSLNGITAVGKAGVPIVTASSGISVSKAANFSPITCTPPAAAGVYLVSGIITTTSGTNTGTVQFTINYVDSQGTTHTGDIIPLVDAAGTVATTKTGASKEFRMMPQMITINNSATNIVVNVVITGTVAYTVAASIEQIA